MAGEGNFPARRKNAQTITGTRFGCRQYKRGFNQVGPAREPLHALGAPVVGAEHHAQRIAAAGALGKDIQLQVSAGIR